MTLPISFVIATKNEERNLPRCLSALEGFDDVLVVDSSSTDSTKKIAQSFNVRFENFNWNGKYPKKRQWILDNVSLKHDFVFFIDADEEMTPSLREELLQCDGKCAGYFIKGQYVIDGKILKYGFQNNKLAFINKNYIEFPVVDDLDIDGMGEIEGHYQPVLKRGARGMKIGRLKSPLKHYAMEDRDRWEQRHEAYAVWQAGIMARDGLPCEDSKIRRSLKWVFFKTPFRGAFYFACFYILKAGFLDGRAGWTLAKSRYHYLQKI